MKSESKRLFISNLSESVSEEDIKAKFQEYGSVTSVEIKERKNMGPNQKSHFAYINMSMVFSDLKNCLENIKAINGENVDLQIAKESFMDRLKRERQQAQISQPPSSTPSTSHTVLNGSSDISSTPFISNNLSKTNIRVYHSSSDEELDSKPFSNLKGDNSKKIFNNRQPVVKAKESNIAKSPEGDNSKKIFSNRLPPVKVEATNIAKSPVKTKKSDKNEITNDPDRKRLQSIAAMKQTYQEHKRLIQGALSSIDTKSKNRIVFNDDPIMEESNTIPDPNKNKPALFTDSDGEEEKSYNFEHRPEFDGEEGQELLKLQSRFKNDKRFKMDSRFREKEIENNENEVEDDDENEKTKNLTILSEIIGTDLATKPTRTPTKMMLRYDPTQPQHSKFEIQENVTRKRKQDKKELATEAKESENNAVSAPIVSKETFYKVDDLQLNEKQEFSLLSTFGRTDYEKSAEETEQHGASTSSKQKSGGRNPFKYDSSDSEQELEEKVKEKPKENPPVAKLWTETFFFKDDDYRLQEGLDFVKHLGVDESDNFTKTRRDLKTIMKAKVRHNLRKNRPFKKKLGGKKRIKIKKALKR